MIGFSIGLIIDGNKKKSIVLPRLTNILSIKSKIPVKIGVIHTPNVLPMIMYTVSILLRAKTK